MFVDDENHVVTLAAQYASTQIKRFLFEYFSLSIVQICFLLLINVPMYSYTLLLLMTLKQQIISV